MLSPIFGDDWSSFSHSICSMDFSGIPSAIFQGKGPPRRHAAASSCDSTYGRMDGWMDGWMDWLMLDNVRDTGFIWFDWGYELDLIGFDDVWLVLMRLDFMDGMNQMIAQICVEKAGERMN